MTEPAKIFHRTLRDFANPHVETVEDFLPPTWRNRGQLHSKQRFEVRNPHQENQDRNRARPLPLQNHLQAGTALTSKCCGLGRFALA